MNKAIRILAVITVLAVVVIAIGQKGAWAAPEPPIDVTGDPDTGSGPFELGGCVTGSVLNLEDGYLLNVSLLEAWNAYRTEGIAGLPAWYWTLPGGTGDIFSCVAIAKVMENGTMIESFPADKGSAEICLDTPLDKEGFIYYYDEFKYFYKDSYGEEYPNWVQVGGPFPGGSKGCVPVTYSGVYAYYAPEAGVPVTGLGGAGLTFILDGSVQVPAFTGAIGGEGGLALGGCVTGNVEDLAEGKGYRMEAEVITSDDIDPLPEKVGEFYECIIDLKLKQNTELIDTLPEPDGNVTICFAIPPNENGTVYFLDKYFDDEPVWVPVGGPYADGIACAPVMKTGYYGMVDVQD